MEFLDTYLKVEQKRFDKKFSYEIFVDSVIRPDSTFIPPMLLQPYIENALWHGLLHKSEPGKISISVTENHEYLIFVIEDDGIGRKAARKVKQSKSINKPISHGTSITSDRLQLFNDIYKTNASVIVEDLHDDNNLSCGTRITLKLPHFM